MNSYFKQFVPKLFRCFSEGYSFSTLRKDLGSGITLGVIALPLAMAFAIAAGASPASGIYTAVIAGFLIALLGGSRFQISGPTGAFVVVIYDIIQRQGFDGLAVATILGGVILIGMALLGIGRWIKYIPYPLTTGFTTGIAVIVFSSQMRDFFGLQLENVPANFIEKWKAYIAASPTIDPMTLGVAPFTLATIIVLRRYCPRIPWGIGAIALATLLCWAFQIPTETVTSRFGDLPRTLPAPSFPSFDLSWEQYRSLIPDAVAIAFLAGIEALLSAVIADGLSGKKHASNVELLAQGLGNIGSALFGGIPATGAIARTATNVKMGAQTPLSAMIHALVILLLTFAFAPIAGTIPLAALAAVLVTIAWSMSELPHFRRLLKAPLGDIAVLLSAFLLTVLVDITVAVGVGMILAAFFFLKRMSDHSPFVSAQQEGNRVTYLVERPFFFGVAHRLKELHPTEESTPPEKFVLQMQRVNHLDATAVHAIKELHGSCQKRGMMLVLEEVQDQPAKVLRNYGLYHLITKPEPASEHVEKK